MPTNFDNFIQHTSSFSHMLYRISGEGFGEQGDLGGASGAPNKKTGAEAPVCL